MSWTTRSSPARPDVVAQLVADPQRWTVWWPDLRLTTTRDRGRKGRQWAVEGALAGTAEIWLEPWWDGVILHYYLRADPAGRPRGAGSRDRAAPRHVPRPSAAAGSGGGSVRCTG